MTTESIASIERRLQQVTAALERLPAEPGSTAAGETIKLLASVADCMRSAEAGILGSRPAAKLIDDMAGCRKTIREASARLDEARSEAAVRYRLAAGADKESFERLKPDDQASANPEAHRHKQTFAALRDCLDELDRITAEMLTLEGRIEHDDWVRQRISTGDGAEIGYTGEHADRSSLSP